MSTGRPSKQKPPIIVVYKKTTNGKPFLKIFENTDIGDIISTKKHTSLIPDSYSILELGIGEYFIDLYKKEYNIKKIK